MTIIIACVCLILILVIVVAVIVVLAQLFPVRPTSGSFVDRLLRHFKGIDGAIWSTIVVLIVSIFAFIGLYVQSRIKTKDLLEGLTAEIAGFIFDLILISLLVNFFAIRRQKNERIQRHHDLIDDFRRWRSEEAKVRIFGAIKRLNELGVTEVNLDRVDFTAGPVKGEGVFFNLTGSSVNGTKFSRLVLRKAVLSGIRGKRSYFVGTQFYNVKVTDSVLESANFNRAVLEDVSFDNTTFKGVTSFANTLLVRTTFKGCSAVFIDFDDAIVGEEFKHQIESWGSARKAVFGSQFLIPFKYNPGENRESSHDLSRIEGKDTV